MANTTFTGPIRVGKDRGNTTSELGTVVVNQIATVIGTTSGATAIRLPDNARIEDISVFVRTAITTSDNAVNVRVGTSADETHYATILASSAGVYRGTPASANNWFSVDASGNTGVQVHVDVTSNGTAAGSMAGLDAILSISYVPR